MNYGTRRVSWLGWMALATLLVSVLVVQPATALPSGEKLFEAHVKAIGGEKMFAKFDTRLTKGVMKMPAMGLDGETTEYSARPNKQLMIISLPGLGEMKSGTDGNVCWESSMMTGPRIKEGVERELTMREANFDGLLAWKDLFTKIECLAEEDVDSVACYKVVATPKAGKDETYYFNKETGLIHKTIMVMESEMGEVPIEAFYSDYTEVDGVKIAFSMRQLVMGNEVLIITNSVEHNVELPADQFELPADIGTLLDK